MNSTKLRLISLWAFFWGALPAAGWCDPPTARLTALELRTALFTAQQRIQSIYVVYESDDYDDESLPAGYLLRRVVACRAPDSLFHWTAHGHDMLPWQDDPGQQIARIRGGVILNEYPLNRSYYEAKLKLKEDGLPGSLPNEFLFSTVGFWPLTGVKPPRYDGAPYVLSEVAQSESYDYVRPVLEEVEGRWCHVLERQGRDRLWLDVDRGCAMMARETHATSSGRLGQRLELGEQREIVPGIWFPAWIRNIQYDHGASDPQKQNRIWKDATHDFLEVRINQTDDVVFDEWTPPAGALLVYDDAPSVQVKAGGLEHLEHLADWIRRSHKVIADRHQRYSPIGYGLSCVVSIIVVTEICIFGKYRKLAKVNQISVN